MFIFSGNSFVKCYMKLCAMEEKVLQFCPGPLQCNCLRDYKANPESSMPKCVDSAKKPDAAMGSIMCLF